MYRPASRFFHVVFVLFVAAASVNAAEYFVSTSGSDSATGISAQTAYRTIQKGVSVLNPGDTLTILPGEYMESVARDNLGSALVDTTVRAQIPNTVLLRGDVPLPPLKKIPNSRYLYEADFDADRYGIPQAVLEHDTLNLLANTADPTEAEFIPGLFHYDAKSKRITLSSVDLNSPVDRLYTVSVTPKSGIYLKNPRQVIIDGISATGYFRIGASREATMVWGIPWGIALDTPIDCTVRNCTTYLNAGGIVMDKPNRNLIDQCVSFGNRSKYELLSGNIIGYGGQNKEGNQGMLIRNCRSFEGGCGIHYYGWLTGPAVMLECLSWHNRGSNLHIKTGRDFDNERFGLIERSITLGGGGASTSRYNIFGGKTHYQIDHVNPTDICFPNETNLDSNLEFADASNLDFRLQPDSRFRKAGPNGTDKGPYQYQANIYYVQPKGSDTSDGLSIKNAWQSLAHACKKLRPGDTLYLEPGTYTGNLTIESQGAPGLQTSIRGRGRSPVIIEGKLTIPNATGLSLERLCFTDDLQVITGQNISLNNCTFYSKSANAKFIARDVADLRLTHSILIGCTLSLESTFNTYLSGNVYANATVPAVVLDATSQVMYSDYNAYQNAQLAWSTAKGSLALALLQSQHDQHSINIAPVSQASASIPWMDHPLYAGRGPLGSNLGHYHQLRLSESSQQFAGPVLHSVTDTTANIEWWTTEPAPDGFQISWGAADQGKLVNTIKLDEHRFGSYSLTGLKPQTKYRMKIAIAHPSTTSTSEPSVKQNADEIAIEFTTAAAPAKPVTYYVALDGDDANTGLSRDKAFRTINHAANLTAPGDSVLIAGGTYKEAVRIRTSGEAKKPITFKSMPGEKVVFNGDQRTMTYAFYIANKHYLHFDGFYFLSFNDYTSMEMPWSDHSPANGQSGIFSMYNSDHVTITRCFNDGRGGGYAPGLVMAVQCADLRVQNCVNTVTMGGAVNAFGCPDLRITNNAFVGNFICTAVIVNAPDQKLYLQNNVLTDTSLTTKALAPFFELGNIESLIEGNNLYYLRIPDEQKQLFLFYDPVAYGRAADAYRVSTEYSKAPLFKEITRLSVADYQKRFNPQSKSIVGDPLFKAAAHEKQLDRDGKPQFMSDAMVGKVDLEFSDLFSTRPELINGDIGLQPAAFNDFHFNNRTNPAR